MQNGIQHENGSYNVRLSLPKKLKEYMANTYDIRAAYLYLKNPVFSNMDIIKQIKIYPPANDGTSRILVIYEVEDVLPEEDNGHYLSIDLGLHNLMTCYDNVGKTFIIGREYLSLSYFYNKEIARVQSQWGRIQAAREMEDLKKMCIRDRDFYLGMDDFMKMVGADVVFPMHFWGDFEVTDRFKACLLYTSNRSRQLMNTVKRSTYGR